MQLTYKQTLMCEIGVVLKKSFVDLCIDRRLSFSIKLHINSRL